MATLLARRLATLILISVMTLVITACGMLPAMPSFSSTGKGAAASEGVRVRITSVPLKIVLAAGGAALQVAADEFLGVRIDAKDLLGQIVEVEQAERDLPPGDIPVVMVINKGSNDVLYWQLTEHVEAIRLRHDDPGTIELKVVNSAPLRVELWVDGDLQEFDIDVELQ